VGLVADIQAIRDDGSLSDAEKRVAIYELKGGALAEAAAQIVGASFNAGDGLRITITQAPVLDEQLRLVVWVSATRNNQPIVFPSGALPFVYVNPPVIHAGAENPLAAAKQMLAETVSRFG
jgi:hypothetical protein